MGVAIDLLLALLGLVSTWRILTKAGRPGWGALVPGYNFVLLFQIAGLPAWQGVVAFLCAALSRYSQLIPSTSIALAAFLVLAGIAYGLWFMASRALAEKFGKSPAFALGMIFLPFIFLPIIAFGRAEYKKDDEEQQLVFRVRY